jgi:hypothetical protein
MSNTKTSSEISTLTPPSDRPQDTRPDVQPDAPPLSEQESREAISALNKPDFVRKFRRVERRYCDPAIDNQRIGLISFIPAKGARPDENGLFGFAKLRGNFATEDEAATKAESLIRTVDSYHNIFHCRVGMPFPITVSSEFSNEITEVDLNKKIEKTVSEDVKAKRAKEQKDIEEIQNREKELLSDVSKDEPTEDRYTTLRVKKAQLTWTYIETEKKFVEMRTLIAKARKEIEDLDRTNPELQKQYYNKYIEARKKAGLSIEPKDTEKSFMRYLVEDANIPAVEEEYRKLYGNQK